MLSRSPSRKELWERTPPRLQALLGIALQRLPPELWFVRRYLVAQRCEACGREHTLLDEVQGRRAVEFLVAKDGSRISWTAVNMHDDTFDNVVRFRFRQDEPGRARLLVVPGPKLCEGDERRMLHNLAGKLEGRVEVEVERCEALALSPASKAHLRGPAHRAGVGRGGPRWLSSNTSWATACAAIPARRSSASGASWACQRLRSPRWES